MSEEARLKPCPFCDGAAEFDRLGDRTRSCIIICTECGCRLETGEVGDNSGRRWNDRTPPNSEPDGSTPKDSLRDQLRVAREVVEVVRLYNLPELLDDLNNRIRSCVDGRDIVKGSYHDASVAADKLRSALSLLPKEGET